MVVVEKPVNCTAREPKPTIAIRSPEAFPLTNARAAATASASALPFIERERSSASTTDFARPRFWALMSGTRLPFSVSAGGVAERCEVTTLTRTSG